MKAIMISDHPKWCALMMNGIKKIEVRSGTALYKATQNIKQMLEKYGYPFKSKQHAHNLYVYQNSGIGLSVKRYLGIIESNTKFRCPKMLQYQFTPDFKIKW